MRVKELMTVAPWSCRLGDTANTAAQIMWERDCGIVPVLSEDGRVAGVITDRDICMAAHFQNLPLTAISIASAMSHQVFACRPQDDVADAERLMRDKQVHRLPVVDADGWLAGMLSLSDVAQAVRRTGAIREKGAGGEELLETVAAVSKPRVSRQVPVA
jgi:CBS domain-containing protein